jgi:hypothetical protein
MTIVMVFLIWTVVMVLMEAWHAAEVHGKMKSAIPQAIPRGRKNS